MDGDIQQYILPAKESNRYVRGMRMRLHIKGNMTHIDLSLEV